VFLVSSSLWLLLLQFFLYLFHGHIETLLHKLESAYGISIQDDLLIRVLRRSAEIDALDVDAIDVGCSDK
jgi:hypothetical protein